MSDAPPIRPNAGASVWDLPMSDLLGIAWLCEVAAIGCDGRGKPEWGDLLREDAKVFRSQAVNQ